MVSETPGEDGQTLSPDTAFAVLGNETRMRILRTLGDADGALSFSTLRDRVGMRDSGQFNYHLDKLTGHFVQQTDGGYALRQAGERVIETVLSGAVTADPVVAPSLIDDPCPICGAATVVAFSHERLEHYCTECAGYYGVTTALDGDDGPDDEPAAESEYGYIGSVQFPPAGLQGRTPDELFRAASTWFILEILAAANRVCPRCSAPLSDSLTVCENHDPSEGTCPECANRHAVLINVHCTNCLFDQTAAFAVTLMTNSDLLAFLLDHGINPFSASAQVSYYAVLMDYEEEVVSVDPFEAAFTFEIDGETLTLAVDDELTVVDVIRDTAGR